MKFEKQAIPPENHKKYMALVSDESPAFLLSLTVREVYALQVVMALTVEDMVKHIPDMGPGDRLVMEATMAFLERFLHSMHKNNMCLDQNCQYKDHKK